ncbi:MAG: hypothetical protein V3T53_16005 [Phycisphaerales bacterium]
MEFCHTDDFTVRLFKLLALRTQGRVQQGLVFAALRYRYGGNLRVTTKKTFAADDQSSRKRDRYVGDIQIWKGDDLLSVIEVKDAVVDGEAWRRVSETHAVHEYALFLVATGFRPKRLQQEISEILNTFALHLWDFLIATVFDTSSTQGIRGTAALEHIIEIYNHEFCEVIENDDRIKVVVVTDN